MKRKYIICLLCIIVFAIGVMAVLKQTQKEKFQTQHKNILDKPLKPCSLPPEKTTGYYRDGYCSTGPTDSGTHVVCAQVDNEFLQYTKTKGNDLVTPQNSFPGLVAGDKWCLCALRWREAYNAGNAPKIFPEATSEVATQYVLKNILMNYALT